MKPVKLALLYGGTSSERDISIAGWKVVREHFDPRRFELFHFDLKYDLDRLMARTTTLDAAFICLHGRGGEDGTLQGFLEQIGLPYQGSGVLASALAMDKKRSKILFRDAGLTVPSHLLAIRDDPPDPRRIEASIGLPVIVKPVREGSSIGLCLAKTPDQLESGLERAFQYDAEVLVEEFLQGVEITGAVLGNRRIAALPLVEIAPGPGHEVFDLQAKYTPGLTEEICPARLDEETTRKAQEAALKAHRALGCRGYSRVDMIVREGRIYVLEVNTIPGMTETSLYPKAAQAAGLDFGALLETLVNLALGAEMDWKRIPADRGVRFE